MFIQSASAVERGINHNTDSPYVKFKNINIDDAKWTSGFWSEKFDMLESTMIPYMGELLKGDIGHGYNNFKIAAGLKEGKAKGFPFHDGDFYKWMESTMYLYAINKDEKLLEQLDEIIAVIAKAQRPDGYLQTHSIIKNIEPYTNRQYHEMYNSGHLINAAVIHHRVTGQTNFLDIAIKNANMIYKLFSPRPKHLARFGFNQTQITGLVELYREVKDRRYLELAELFINMRGAKGVSIKLDDTVRLNKTGDMVQERTAFREETDAVGHAVLAMYFYAGAADVYAETGEKALLDALNRVWSSANERKMYVTGALGQSHHGFSESNDPVHEAFLNDYMMPNATAYNEVCANITNAMFNWRMLGLSGDAKHTDIMETVLYNSALSGISADGKHYFYTNPTRRTHGAKTSRFGNEGTTATVKRESYLNCFCCPPNLMRTLAKLSGWAYSLPKNGIAVNIYGGNELDTQLLDGSSLKLTQETQYPWEGLVTLTINEAKTEAFDVLLRVPGWANNTTIKVNGKSADVDVIAGKYATITRQWKKGDVITLDMPLDVYFVEGNALIEEVRNQVAVKRGPVVYVAESPDLPEDAKILDLYLAGDTQLIPELQTNFSGSQDTVTTLKGTLLLREDTNTETMYNKVSKPIFKPFNTQLVPYYAWSNRGTAEMSVFLPVVWGELGKEVKDKESSWWPF
ncbi:beta-L-arabinofuranosidase domain-containing protein [Colwellia sp. UCD-KL20]|uniref:glycoside hydrolase family 127 protein n=1 Tax=Colwellia sp. UCD-KL20 TaxID=1917165 RepID=UPI0009703341|nr:beta-L-arabinofuranosidase domain-containing protein [Colwellia sp. UCD-KL20]